MEEQQKPAEKPASTEPAAALFAAPEGAKDTGRYAVYDRRFGRYVGGVSTDRPSKADSKKLAGHDDVAIVEV